MYHKLIWIFFIHSLQCNGQHCLRWYYFHCLDSSPKPLNLFIILFILLSIIALNFLFPSSHIFSFNKTSTAVCTSTCGSGFYQYTACTATTNRICTPCTAVCGTGTYEATSCTSTTNRVCLSCTAACQAGTYQSTACTSTTNRVCSCKIHLFWGVVLFSLTFPAPNILYSLFTNIHVFISQYINKACSSACGTGTYMSTACGGTTDRICSGRSLNLPLLFIFDFNFIISGLELK